MKKIEPSPDEWQPTVTNDVETTAQEIQSKYFKPFHRRKQIAALLMMENMVDCCFKPLGLGIQ